ncbi:acetyltransferase [Lactobacillus sp. HMSC072E07]|nr:acetyltransferase [Lactobacillus sp. HMSC072E07]
MMFVSTIFMRVAMPADIPAMMKVIASARQFLGAQGIDQWQGTYPDQAAIEQDIATGIGRVLIVDGRVAGVAALVVGPDPHYLRIDGAGWLADVPYLAVHRFALDGSIRGKQLSRVFFSNIMSEAYRRGFDDLRVDTHAKNVIMQHAITGMGFEFRGIVYMDEPVPERNAYEVRLTSV